MTRLYLVIAYYEDDVGRPWDTQIVAEDNLAAQLNDITDRGGEVKFVIPRKQAEIER